MYLPRSAAPRLEKLLANFPAVVVAGARQVGKSTLLRHLFAGRAEIVVLDALADVGGARSEPELFLDLHPPTLVLDEIQYAPELVPALKRRIDRDRRPGQYVLTGSQQWEVLRTLSESLAGRVAFLDLESFSQAEISGTVDESDPGRSWLELWLESAEALLDARPQRIEGGRPLYERLWRGMLPQAELLDAELIGDFHEAYQRTYIERDARLAGDVQDWQAFARFFRMAAALTGQEIHRSQLGRELGLSPQTARRWLDMLLATFQWYEVPPWSGNTLKRVSKRAKGYMADSGTACAALRLSSPAAVADHPARGALFETAVVAEVRKLASLLASKPYLHHWRAHSGAEVDLVLERDGTLFPIEIKTTARPAPKDLRGTRRFREAFPKVKVAPGLLIAPMQEIQRMPEGDLAIPWDLAPVR